MGQISVRKRTAKTAKPGKRVTITVETKRKKAKAELGGIAPDFHMPATVLGKVSMHSLKGKTFVLYFYPKDDTSGCTAEACDFQEAMPAFRKLGVPVIGVSKDSLESHQKFSKKYNLKFPLAADEDGKVCEHYGVWVKKSMYGRSYMGIERSTFLIDGNSIIRAIWRKVSVPGHVEEVRKALKTL